MEKTPAVNEEVQRLQRAVEELTLLNDLAVAASSSIDVDQMLNVIVQKSIKAVRAEQGSISLLTEEKSTPLKTLIRHVDTSHLMNRYRVGTPITGWVLKNQKPLMVENLSRDERFRVSDEEAKQIRTVLCVPIWCRARIIGLLMMINKKTEDPFNANDLRLLSIIASQSGQLIRNSQLQAESVEKQRMEQELIVSRRIQMGLIPQNVPEHPSLEMASFFNPAEEVGGDYYDYFTLQDEKLGVVIADVSGHGPPAAMMMTMVKGILHSIVLSFKSAKEAIAEINTILNRIMPRNIFITMMFLVFDSKKKELLFSNAGHNPLYLYKNKSRSGEMIHLPGCALNLSPASTFQEKIIPLYSGDFIFIYTDGVTEAVNEKLEMFEAKRLAQILKDVPDRPAVEIVEEVRHRLSEFTGQQAQADDIAMIAIKIR
jgi:sigma-B regulation protein RsbU (phosphoserine phosphatase)